MRAGTSQARMNNDRLMLDCVSRLSSNSRMEVIDVTTIVADNARLVLPAHEFFGGSGKAGTRNSSYRRNPRRL